LVESCAPQGLELSEHAPDPADLVRVCPDKSFAADGSLCDEPDVLQHRDMLLDGGKTHVIGSGQGTDRSVGHESAPNDVASGRVGKRPEEPIHISIRKLLMYNHLVVR
jgi:hypothetical protein